MTEYDIEQIERATLDILNNQKTDSHYLALVRHFLSLACQWETTNFPLLLRMLKLYNRLEEYVYSLDHPDEPRLADLLKAPQLNNPRTQHLLETLQASSAPATPSVPPPHPMGAVAVGYRAPFIGNPTTRYLLSLLRQRT